MTDVFYYSNNSNPCSKILQKLEKMPHIRSKFQYVSIDHQQPSHSIQHVPAVVIEGKVLQGKEVFDWLEKETVDNTLPPFEMGFGTTNFSSITSDDAPAENNHNFTYIENHEPQSDKMSMSKSQNGGKQQKISDGALDNLINQRKIEIPIPRQRS